MDHLNLAALLTEALEFAPLSVCVTDSSGVPAVVSRELCRAMQVERDVLCSRNLLQQLSWVDSLGQCSSVEQIIAELGAQGGFSGWKGIVTVAREISARALQFLLAVYPLAGANENKGYYLHFETPLEYNPQRQQEYRLELLGSIAGGVVHDLNNILAGVLGHLSFLKLSLNGDPSVGESLRIIEDGSKLAARITNQVLEFTRGEPGKRDWIQIVPVVEAAAVLLQAILPKHVSLELSLTPHPLLVYGDESLITQVVMNLVINSRDAMPKGGRISVVVEPFLLAGAQEGHREWARLVVTDTGVGMSEETKRRIFEPFFTTKTKKGTGLGLSNVISIVEGYGGNISVKSVVGEGTSFEVLLPATFKGARLPTTPSDSPALPTGRGEILVVEDEEIVRTVMQRSLELLGYSVVAAAGGREAIELFAASPLRYQLVVLDMMMPELPGDEVFKHLRAIRADVPVLIASGFASDVRVREMLAAGRTAFIQKPFSVEEFAEKVRERIENRSVVK